MFDLGVAVYLDDASLLSLLSTLRTVDFHALKGRVGLWAPKLLQRLERINTAGLPLQRVESSNSTDASYTATYLPHTWQALGLLIDHALVAELQTFEVPLDDAWGRFTPCVSDRDTHEEIADFTYAWARYIAKLKKDATGFWDFAGNVRALCAPQFHAVLVAARVVATAHADALLPSLHRALEILLTTTEQPNVDNRTKAWAVVEKLSQREDAVGDVVTRFYLDDIVLRMVLSWRQQGWSSALHDVAFALGEHLLVPLSELGAVPKLTAFCEQARVACEGLD
eukprot:GEMP01052058.1.p1 GENE.GEMP01052058.1~~GEMP01052058.1.p1  ORF type:complete len:329 (+),score=65.76 GEMP01052058.1:143-988(+)